MTPARVEIVDLGAAGVLAAEYDAEADVVRVDARTRDRVAALLGDDAADRFVAYAVAHECFHRAHPRAPEAAAHAAAAAASGIAASAFAAALRR